MPSVETHHHLTLPCHPFSILIPDFPAPAALPSTSPFARPPHCASAGRLVLRPATTHQYRPNFCRRWTCPTCHQSRVHSLLRTLAQLLVPLDRVYFGTTTTTALANRVARLSSSSGRLTATLSDARLFVVSDAPLTLTSGTAESALVGLAVFLTPDPSSEPPSLATVKRTRFVGTWADPPEPDPAVPVLRNVEPHLAAAIFSIAVDRARERFGCERWSMGEPLPAAVDVKWWVGIVAELARTLGSE